ncbi:MAG: DUF362 domain-containing protein [Gemmatimonadales bacterium]|nr:DUF362 domain-containing protein [Gemmatimonadales bacterium]NIR02940.1 DUF362 domain-containing protein [Gemmatimonadales bacterium]
MERREFLKKAGPAVAVAAVTGTTGLVFHNRQPTRRRTIVAKTTSFEVPPDPALPRVTLAGNTDPAAALNAALDGIGGIGRFVHPGETVTVKPNVGWDRTPAQGANTHPALVGEMVRLCLAAGAARVIVTDVSCNDPRRSFIRSGIKQAAEDAGARVVIPSDDDFVEADLRGQVLRRWPVLRYFIETDRLINMPIVKQHSLTRCTLGMKNLYGILGGRRNRLHQEIDQSIVDLAAFVRPTLTVVDATRVLHRGGPQGGSLADVSVENTVICATDQVAADSRAVEFLGLRGRQIGHIVLADESGLGSLDYRTAGYREMV